MVEITFLELNFEDTAFNATKRESPMGGDDVTFEAGEPEPVESDGGRAGTLVAVFVGLLFLLAVSYVAKRRFLDDDPLLSDDEDAFDEYDGYDD